MRLVLILVCALCASFALLVLGACESSGTCPAGGGGAGGDGGSTTVPPVCPGELPVADCPAVDAALFEQRCAVDMAKDCPAIGAAHVHVLGAGQLAPGCDAPPPLALYLGATQCTEGSAAPDVHLFCW